MLKRWLWLAKRLGPLLCVYTLLRLLFFLCNRGSYRATGLSELALAFLQGVRFDFCAVLASNLVFIGLALVARRSFSSEAYFRVLRWVFVLFNLPFLLLNIEIGRAH